MPFGSRCIPFFSITQMSAIPCTRKLGTGQEFGTVAVNQRFSVETSPSALVYVSLLKDCHREKALSRVKSIQAHLYDHKVQLSGLLGDYLVVSLAKCGAIEDALIELRNLNSGTVFSWTAVISASVECGRYHDALALYQSMLEDHIEPDQFTFVSLLKACANLLNLEKGRQLHTISIKKGYLMFSFMANSLITMYGKCRSVEEAEAVFCGLFERDIVSWNALLSAYKEQNQGMKALQLYRQIQEEGLVPNQATFVMTLQVCGYLIDHEDILTEGLNMRIVLMEIGWALYSHAKKDGFGSDLLVGNAFLSMCSKCGTLAEATVTVFTYLLQHDIVSWNTVISYFIEKGKGEEALQIYTKVHEISNEVTLAMLLMACGILAGQEDASIITDDITAREVAFQIGQALHIDACVNRYASDTTFGTSLVSFYGQCGATKEAESVFIGLPQRNCISWNSMLSVYVDEGHGTKALLLYRQMLEEGVQPDVITFTIVLRACITLAIVPFEIGQGLHADAKKKSFDSDAFLCNAIINMYAKSGAMAEAENVLCRSFKFDEFTLAAMLSAYVEQGEPEKVLQVYNYIKVERMPLSNACYIYVMKACSQLGNLNVCRSLHFMMVISCVDLNIELKSSLISVYRTSASITDAQAVFDELFSPDIVSWNACIDAYALQGDCIVSLQMIEKLQLEGIIPNTATFISVLTGFSHAGLVNEGLMYIMAVNQCYGTHLELKHYSSMADLLGRAGDFKRLISLLRNSQIQPDVTFWLCILGACQVHGNEELGNFAFQNAVRMQPGEHAAYVLMSNIYSDTRCKECIQMPI